MDHNAHAVLVLATAIFVVFGGLAVLALGGRREVRGERSGVVLGELTARQTVLSYVAVPAVGLTGIVAISVAAAALR